MTICRCRGIEAAMCTRIMVTARINSGGAGEMVVVLIFEEGFLEGEWRERE